MFKAESLMFRYEEKKSDSSGVTKFVGNTQCNKEHI